MWPEAAGVREELDRSAPVLRQTFLDLARLLVGVHVENESLARRRLGDCLEPLLRARAHRMRREAHAGAAVTKLRNPLEVFRQTSRDWNKNYFRNIVGMKRSQLVLKHWLPDLADFE